MHMSGYRLRKPGAAVLEGIARMSQTRWNYWGEFALDIPVGVLLVQVGLRHSDIRPVAAILTFLAGLALFSLIEYAFHRWLFHGSIRILAEGHREHHLHPLGYSGLPFFLPALLLIGLAGLFALPLPIGYALLLTGAIAMGYVTYGLSHFTIHHVRLRYSLPRRWAAHHHIHHFHPEGNFGVTSPLWDRVFATRYQR